MSMIKDYLVTGLSYLYRPSKRKLIEYSFHLRGKKGLEIGGPSQLFSLKGSMPVYLFASQLDGVNFSTETVWEGAIREGHHYRYHNKTGYQFIKEAADLSDIPDASYDFVLSCHSLEHVANPLKALEEWVRVLKKGGMLILILPDKRYTFDVNRPYTTMEHLLQDYNTGINEHDDTHFAEILQHHREDLSANQTMKAEQETLLKDNFNNRRAHHHVFSLELSRQILEHSSCKILHQQTLRPFHLVTVGQKSI